MFEQFLYKPVLTFAKSKDEFLQLTEKKEFETTRSTAPDGKKQLRENAGKPRKSTGYRM